MHLDQPEIIAPPSSPADWDAWRQELITWRKDKRRALNYDGHTYSNPDYKWISSCYSCNMLMSWDEMFLDHRTGHYRVDEYVQEGRRHFGGYDAVVLWQAYPRVGFDQRNQYDFYRELPGGLDGIHKMVQQFHKHDVRVFIDYNPWDTGTRREGKSDADAIASVVHATGVDGIFLDTMNQGGLDMRDAVDHARAGVAFESEDALPLDSIALNHLSWAQWFGYGEAPALLRNRWFEQRHMMHVIRRWDTDHTNELHLAWMNGAGMLVWENVFGSWVGWSIEDRKLLRSMLPIQRFFTRHFSHGAWTPLVPTLIPGVYASEWSHEGIRLWTIVNRTNRDVKGPHLDIRPKSGELLFDLITGLPMAASASVIPAHGIAAAILVSAGAVSAPLKAFLANQSRLIHQEDHSSRVLHPLPISPQSHNTKGHDPSANMIAVPAGDHKVTTHFRVRECGERGYAHLTDSTYPGLHQDVPEVRSFHLDGFAVSPHAITNRQYLDFLHASGYRPKIADNFLKHWVGGRPVEGQEDFPVVYVDLLDARAYCRWAGLRLPSEAEWQVAFEQNPRDVDSRTVWNWTDTEYSDGRTRYCLIKGGSWFEAKGSDWYADGGQKAANFAAKFIEIWPGLDRCETLGFRSAISL